MGKEYTLEELQEMDNAPTEEYSLEELQAMDSKKIEDPKEKAKTSILDAIQQKIKNSTPILGGSNFAGVGEAAGRAIGIKGAGGPLKDLEFQKPALFENDVKGTLKQAYEEGRQADIDRTKLVEEEHPMASKIGTGVGTVANIISAGKVLGPISKLPNALSRISAGGLTSAGIGAADQASRSNKEIGSDEFNQEVNDAGMTSGYFGAAGQGISELLSKAIPKIGKAFAGDEQIDDAVNLGKKGVDINEEAFLDKQVKNVGNAGDKYSAVVKNLQSKYQKQYNELMEKYGAESVEVKKFINELQDDITKKVAGAQSIEEKDAYIKLASGLKEEANLPANQTNNLKTLRNYELKKKQGLESQDPNTFINRVKNDIKKKVAEKTRASLPEEGKKTMESLDKQYSGVSNIKEDYFNSADELPSSFRSQVKNYAAPTADARVSAQKGIDDFVSQLKQVDPEIGAQAEKEIIELSKMYQAGKISEAELLSKINPLKKEFWQLASNKVSNPNSLINKLPRSLQPALLQRINEKKAERKDNGRK